MCFTRGWEGKLQKFKSRKILDMIIMKINMIILLLLLMWMMIILKSLQKEQKSDSFQDQVQFDFPKKRMLRMVHLRFEYPPPGFSSVALFNSMPSHAV